MTKQQPRRPSMLKSLFRLACLLGAGVLLGFALLWAVFLLPVDSMEQNVLLSIPAMDGSWGTGEEAYEQVLKGYQTTQLDNTTDASMLLTAIHRSDQSALQQAINVYTYHHTVQYRQYDTLMQLGETGLVGMEDTATTRYWLGYLILLKPLLLVFTYMDIRMLNVIGQGLMLLGICMLMQRRGLGRYVLPFALSLVCVTPLATGLSLQFSTALWVMGAAMLVLLWKPEWVKSRLGYGAFFLLTGMATSYFDFLTYPLITFGMPFVLLVLLNESKKPGRLWTCFVACGAAWVCGYLGMWAGKWLLAALLGNSDFWSSVVGSIQVRTSTEVRDADAAISRLDALRQVGRVFAKKPYLLLAMATAVGYGAAYVRGRANRLTTSAAPYGVLAAVAALPVLWVMVTANHAYIHAFYTSRVVAVTAFALLCAVSRGCRRKQDALKEA
ncbi:MAG: hypothetical protein PHI98_06080 [Eubacteriales bacterium]|nr:hypothetical protein [Eubacteriales bacterium]